MRGPTRASQVSSILTQAQEYNMMTFKGKTTERYARVKSTCKRLGLERGEGEGMSSILGTHCNKPTFSWTSNAYVSSFLFK